MTVTRKKRPLGAAKFDGIHLDEIKNICPERLIDIRYDKVTNFPIVFIDGKKLNTSDYVVFEDGWVHVFSEDEFNNKFETFYEDGKTPDKDALFYRAEFVAIKKKTDTTVTVAGIPNGFEREIPIEVFKKMYTGITETKE